MDSKITIKNFVMVFLFISSLFYSIALKADEGESNMKTYFLIDDFSSNKSTLNTPWEGFTDQVMGGVSEIYVNRIREEDGSFIRMSGKVSLENNGGFIQIRLKLGSFFKPFDGSSYKGIRILTRGTGSAYYIFLRTTATVLPWKYYSAVVSVSPEWQYIDIPWSAFNPGDYGSLRKFKVSKLKSLALVAYGKEFSANIEMKEIGLY